MPDRFTDPYLDSETGILRNLVGARNYDELENAEGELASSRATEFVEHGVFRPTGSLADFQRIHRALFQDIYDWAGEIRTVELRKNVVGAEYFLPAANIPMGVAWAQGELVKR